MPPPARRRSPPAAAPTNVALRLPPLPPLLEGKVNVYRAKDNPAFDNVTRRLPRAQVEAAVRRLSSAQPSREQRLYQQHVEQVCKRFAGSGGATSPSRSPARPGTATPPPPSSSEAAAVDRLYTRPLAAAQQARLALERTYRPPLHHPSSASAMPTEEFVKHFYSTPREQQAKQRAASAEAVRRAIADLAAFTETGKARELSPRSRPSSRAAASSRPPSATREEFARRFHDESVAAKEAHERELAAQFVDAALPPTRVLPPSVIAASVARLYPPRP